MSTAPAELDGETRRPRRGRTWGTIGRGVAGLLGEVLITAGAVVLLFVGWQLWWTNAAADADGAQVVAALQHDFDDPTVAQPEPDSTVIQPEPEPGTAFAVVHIPRFGSGFARPLYEGTGQDVLARGIGHYLETEMPGEVGNFAIAGHRNGHGEPFNRIADLLTGDAVIVETRSSWFVYRVTGREVVPPTQVGVLLPVPDAPGSVPTKALLTMTSCHPLFSTKERYIVYGELENRYPRREGPPAEIFAAN